VHPLGVSKPTALQDTKIKNPVAGQEEEFAMRRTGVKVPE
jgi:hypothetical protein